MTGKTNKTSKAINPAMLKAYNDAAAGTDAQVRAFIIEAAKALKTRKVSLAVLKETIALGQKTHKGFAVKYGHAQDIQRAAALLGLTGADAAGVAAFDALTLAVAMRDKSGRSTLEADAEMMKAMKSGKTFQQVAEETAAAQKKHNADEKERKEKEKGTAAHATADDILRATVAALRDLEDVTVSNRATVAELLNILKIAGAMK